MEETQRATASSVKNQAKKKSGPQYKKHQKKELRAPRVGRFHDYTPLSVSLADLYRKVGQVENSQSRRQFGYEPTPIGPFSVNTTAASDIRRRIATIFRMLLNN